MLFSVVPMTTAPALRLSGTRVWRWVLLCALTTYCTLFVIVSYEKTRRIHIDYAADPLRAGFVGIAFLFSVLFLLLGTPFLFGRLRSLVLAAWLALFASVVYDLLS